MKEKFYVVSLSGGKDSTAMLLRLIEENRPIDKIIYAEFCPHHKNLLI